MASGLIEPRETRACIWDSHALLNQVRAREADEIGTALGSKIAADCREAAKRALDYSRIYRK
jgi:hypothetical protein